MRGHRRLFAIAFAALLAFGAAQSAAQEASCSLVRGRILVPVWINEVGPFYFLLDSALRRPVVTPEVAGRLGLPVEMGKLDNGEKVRLAALGSVRAAGQPPQTETAVVAGVEDIAETLAVGLHGLLPAHYPGFEIAIEAAVPRVTWRPLGLAAPFGEDCDLLDMTLDASGAPCVPVRVNEAEPIAAQVDTVAPDLIALPESALVAMGIAMADAPKLVVDDGLREQAYVRLDALEVGRLQVSRPVCRVLPEGKPAVLGARLFEYAAVALAYETGRLRLTPSGSLPRLDPPWVGYGFGPTRFAQDRWGMRVAVDSPAWRAGLRPGCGLVAVGGMSLAGAGQTAGALYPAMAGLLAAKPGDSISVTFEALDVVTLKLTAEELL